MRLPLAASLALVLVASSAAAAPVFRFTWGPADALVFNQDFAGPATYSQTMSVTGLTGTVSQFHVQLAHPFYGPGSAWHAINPQQFDTVSPPQADCEGEPGFSVSTTVAGATMPGGATPTVQYNCFPGVTNHTITCYTSITVTFDPPFVADPAVRYGMLTLEYHHQNSVVGTSPVACDGAELPMCFVQISPVSMTV